MSLGVEHIQFNKKVFVLYVVGQFWLNCVFLLPEASFDGVEDMKVGFVGRCADVLNLAVSETFYELFDYIIVGVFVDVALNRVVAHDH